MLFVVWIDADGLEQNGESSDPVVVKDRITEALHDAGFENQSDVSFAEPKD